MYDLKSRSFQKSAIFDQQPQNEELSKKQKELREKTGITDDWLTKSDLGRKRLDRSSIDISLGKSIIGETRSRKSSINDSWVLMDSQSGRHKNTLERSCLQKSTISIGDREVDLGASKMDRENFKWGTATVQILDRSEIQINDLQCSRIEVQDNDIIIIEREVKDLASNQGTPVLMKLELMARVVDLIYTGTSGAVKNWKEIICGVTGILGGGAQMISFNPYSIAMGGVRVFASVKLMLDAYNALTATQIQEMIEDSKASIDAIKILAQANEDSLGRVQKQLKTAQACSKNVQEQLLKIAAIKEDAGEKLIKLKEEAKNAYLSVDKFLTFTGSKMKEANEMSEKAEKGFGEVVEALGTMILLFNCTEGTDKDRLKALADLTKKISETAEIAHRDMQEARRLQSEAEELFNKVIQWQSEAAEAYGKVSICQEMTLENMLEEAKKANVECKKLSNDLNSIEAGVDAVGIRNEEIRDYAKEAADTLGDLIGVRINEDRIGLLKGFAIGLCTLAFNMLFDGTTSVILAVAFVTYANNIANFIADWLARKVAKESTHVTLTDEISYEFEYRSEYVLQRARGKVSQDKGTLTIVVGNETLNMRFDLTRKSSSIRQTDLFKLGKVIHDAVLAGKMTVEKGFELIKVLKTAEIQRKTQNLYFADKNVNKTGFVAEDSVVMKQLERFLDNQRNEEIRCKNLLNGTYLNVLEALEKHDAEKVEFGSFFVEEAEFVEASEEEDARTLSVSDLPIILWC